MSPAAKDCQSDEEDPGDQFDEEMQIRYPYQEYNNSAYSEFMLKLMNCLEIRHYSKNIVIASEIDECLEVIFVEQGYYKIGYQINNHGFYRIRFGMFTVIGGFNVCYDRRFNFMFKTVTDIKALAIRKSKFKQLLSEYKDFAMQIKHKFWKHYCQNIYLPLRKHKNADLSKHNQRKDFKQVLILKNKL